MPVKTAVGHCVLAASVESYVCICNESCYDYNNGHYMQTYPSCAIIGSASAESLEAAENPLDDTIEDVDPLE